MLLNMPFIRAASAGVPFPRAARGFVLPASNIEILVNFFPACPNVLGEHQKLVPIPSYFDKFIFVQVLDGDDGPGWNRPRDMSAVLGRKDDRGTFDAISAKGHDPPLRGGHHTWRRNAF